MSQRVRVLGLGRRPVEMKPLGTDNKPDTGDDGGVPALVNGRIWVLLGKLAWGAGQAEIGQNRLGDCLLKSKTLHRAFLGPHMATGPHSPSALPWAPQYGLPQAGLLTLLGHFSYSRSDAQPQGHFPRAASPRLGLGGPFTALCMPELVGKFSNCSAHQSSQPGGHLFGVPRCITTTVHHYKLVGRIKTGRRGSPGPWL